jgi:hypothetical protein
MPVSVVKSGSITEDDVKNVQITRTPKVGGGSDWACEILYDGGDGNRPLIVELSESAKTDLDTVWGAIKSELTGAAETAEGL